MGSRLAADLERIKPLIDVHVGTVHESVYGVVDRVDVVDGKLVNNYCRKWKGTIGNMRPTDEEPTITIAEKLEPLITKHKKWKLIYGGRAGTKSIAAMDCMIGDVNAYGSKVYALRERMKSLKDTIYSGVRSRIGSLDISGFTPVPSEREIRHVSGGLFSFGGMQNIIDMKGSFNFKYFLLEEAARTSQQTLDTLGPTLRGVGGCELWAIWNPEASNDPMSTEFILPYQEHLDRNGYYEDEYHIIININHVDNPWFEYDESLREELAKDRMKVEEGRMSKARFNHIWKGGFNDSVENAIIEADWFDACIDAHKKLGFEPIGATIAAHDPADTGGDAKGYAARKGVVFTDIEEIDSDNANNAFDVACGYANAANVNWFIWDCDGMGSVLRNQAAQHFDNTQVKPVMFKGSESPHNPDVVFQYTDNYGFHEAKTNADVFRNKRSQNYTLLAERMRKTYEAVQKAKSGICPAINTDELISFDSSISCLPKLRSELSRLPLKPNAHNMIQLYTKQEMRAGVTIIGRDGSKSMMRIPSPNLADCIMMAFDKAATMMQVNKPYIPKPRPVMGRR